MDESVAEHVNGSLALLQHNVADTRLELSVFGLHVHKNDLAENRFEPFDPDTHWTTHDTVDGRLRRQFEPNSADFLQIAEAIPPCRG